MSARPITDTLRLLEGGAFLDHASTELAQLVRRVDDTGRAGRITLTLDVRPARARGAMEITPTLSSKAPEDKPEATLLWATEDGNLQANNPRQQSLDLRTVDTATGEIRDITSAR